MSDITPEEYKKRAELLKTARQLLTQDYVYRRTEGHKQWIADSESSWRTNGALLPYPSGSLYPTEGEIVAKALELYNLSLASQSQPVATTVATSIPLPTAPAASAATFSPETTNDVVQQLQAVYHKGDAALPTIPSVPLTTPWEEMLSVPQESVAQPTVEPVSEPTEEVVEPESNVEVIPEELIEEIAPDIAAVEPETEVKAPPKNSLLRSVLSSWLQKNKDNT